MKLSEKFDPGLNNGDRYFQSRFREINEAYDTLGNPYNRQQYDSELNAFYNGQVATTVALNRRWSGTGIGMTIVLILIAVIFADYVFQYFKTAEHKKAKEVYAADAITDTVPKKHMKRYALKNRIAHNNPTIAGQKIAINPPKPGQEKWTLVDHTSASVIKQAVVKRVVKSPADSVKRQTAGQYNNGVLYTTYVNPNATGVVNLRLQDAYSSPIFATIPANSKVAVLERGDTYYKISFFRYTGYVPKWALQIK
jgi:curved DNA-binding protein CbpA